jgi:Haem-dependent oxidative N-demethylase, alpha subunit-like
MRKLPPQAVHVAFEPGPYRMQMGLTAVPPDEFVEIDATYPAEMAERRHLLATRHAEVFSALPGSEPACAEVLARLAGLLPARFPEWFARDGRVLHNHLTGEAWNLADPGLHPLELAGRLVAEDLCILQPGANGPVLTAAVLCFPTRWLLSDKIGQPLASVHGPVPIYPERLAAPVDRLLGRLVPGKLVQRLNWSLLDDPSLFQPVRRSPVEADATITPGNAGDRLYLRTERQTLSALPASGAVLFGIRVHVCPLSRIAAAPAIAARLAEAVRALPPEIRHYKRLHGFEAALLRYLDARAGLETSLSPA